MPRREGDSAGTVRDAGGVGTDAPRFFGVAIPPAVLEHLGHPPPRDVEGRPNPDYYRWMYALGNMLAVQAILQQQRLPFNYESFIRGVDQEAKAAGFDPKLLKDRRSDAQVMDDAVDRLLGAPDARWEVEDRTADLIEERMKLAVDLCQQIIDGMVEGDRDKAAERIERGKAWVRRLEQVRRLRNWARHPVPKTDAWRGHAHAWRASRVLRLMLYVGRSNIPSKDPLDRVFQIARHHAHMAVAIWEAEHKVWIDASGVHPGGFDYSGAVVVAPPGHGKSELANHKMLEWLADDPDTQGIWGHAQAEKAQENVQYIASCFQATTEQGRRFAALFGGMSLVQESGRQFRLDRPHRLKQPTLQAFGMKAAINGANASKIVLDDIVDQKEVHQETERKRTFDRLTGTVLQRKRGAGRAFDLTVCTLWHEDDANNRRIQMARRKKARLRVCILACGGPDEQFRPLWPEMYPARYLREQHALNSAVYAAAFQGNPTLKTSRIVRAVRLYAPYTRDGRLDPEHERYLNAAAVHLSVDPAATNREQSDKAGIVVLAEGPVSWETADELGPIHHTERRVRVLDAYQMHATQSEAVEWIGDYLERHRRVRSVHVETKSAFVGMAEMFKNKYGLDVVRHEPGQKSKEIRLRGCAAMIDNSLAHLGTCAVVEFPGVWERGDDGETTLVPDPDIAWLIDEVLNFGVCAHDHGLDALTQVLNWMAPDVGVGAGAASAQVIQAKRKVIPGRPEVLGGYIDVQEIIRRQAEPVEDTEWLMSPN
jgi:hypothetical protein